MLHHARLNLQADIGALARDVDLCGWARYVNYIGERNNGTSWYRYRVLWTSEITVAGVPDLLGIASKILGPVGAKNIEVDMIVQNTGVDGMTDFTHGKAVRL